MSECSVIIELKHEFAKMPSKAYPSDACFDLYIPDDAEVLPGTPALLDLGICMEMPEGWEAQIRGRSGLARRGLMVHFGTVDHLYRKNVGVIVFNCSKEPIYLKRGDRIAQVKFARVFDVEIISGTVECTQRDGFGSTGR